MVEEEEINLLEGGNMEYHLEEEDQITTLQIPDHRAQHLVNRIIKI